MSSAFKLASYTCGHQTPVRGYDRHLDRPCPSCDQDGRSQEGAPHTVPATMNSTEALDYALDKLERIKISPQRADAFERAAELQAAIETLSALRDLIAERDFEPSGIMADP
jgi:hypothetical protein